MSIGYTISSTATTGSVILNNGTTTTITNGSTIPWNHTTTGTFTIPNTAPVMTIPHGENKVILDEKAALDVKGTIKLNGLDLEERLKTIERVLAIPERDAKMEAKYPSLKKKFDDYINSLEKYRTFERIKGDDNA